MVVGVTATAMASRSRQFRRLWRSEGARGVVDRARRRAASVLAPAGSAPLGIGDDEFEAAARLADRGWRLPSAAPWAAGDPLSVAWVCTPPAPGSGGHTTMFRLVDALMKAGHESTVYLIDRHGWDMSRHIERIRAGWPDMNAQVLNFDDGIKDVQAIFATSWESAWTILRSSAQGLRCYLVQDFEPSFYAAGSQYMLAEATYSFGFRGVTIGKWLPAPLRERYGMESVALEFGADTDRYVVKDPDAPRIGVCYYCRPSTPRRAHELALAALRLFAGRNPSVPIHFFGERVETTFPSFQHGTLMPSQLNDLYNDCSAGLTLSATNVSLVPHEMLASGCIPVVNDAPQSRLVLENDQVEYATPTPNGLAGALERIAGRQEHEKRAAVVAAAASVSGRSWDRVMSDFVWIVERLVASSVGLPTPVAP